MHKIILSQENKEIKLNTMNVNFTINWIVIVNFENILTIIIFYLQIYIMNLKYSFL